MAHLLVVDDEADIRHLYQAELEDDGHSVVTCGDHSAALEQLRHQAFDLVVLDVQLAETSGLDLLQQITREFHSTPVILCTAYSSYQDDFASWLADAYVVKSSDLEILKREVRRVLSHHNDQETR
jgi:DNA-binding response OmpR family regulator